MANSASSNELHSITKHNNIAISGVGANEVLKFDGSNWINQTLVESGIAALSGAAFTGAITGVTALTVDNLNLNGNTLLANSGAVNITPAAGSAIVLDSTINVDAGVVTGATSITSTEFYGGGGNLTGISAGTALTGSTNNTITTVTGANAIVGEANLLFDGTLLRIGSAASSTSASFLEITGTMPTHGSIGHVVIQSTDSMAADKGGELLLGGVYTGSSRTAMGGIGAFKENSSDGNYAGYLSLYSRTHGATVAASEGIRINSVGAVTMPKQPAVAAFNSSSDTGVTGDGTPATVDFNTEVYDQNADFASDTFTAPVTGRYQVNANVRWWGTTANTYIQLRIVSSNRDWFTYADDIQGGQDNDTVMISALIDMDAADTLTIVFKHYGESSNVEAVYGAAAPHTYVTVHLVA